MRRSSSRRGTSTPAPPPPARPRRAPEAPLAPAPPLARDPWAWVAVLGVIPLIVRAWGAPLGEPVAEDFDFLHYALFQRFSPFDGGGSSSFWRPLAHQG